MNLINKFLRENRPDIAPADLTGISMPRITIDSRPPYPKCNLELPTNRERGEVGRQLYIAGDALDQVQLALTTRDFKEMRTQLKLFCDHSTNAGFPQLNEAGLSAIQKLDWRPRPVELRQCVIELTGLYHRACTGIFGTLSTPGPSGAYD